MIRKLLIVVPVILALTVISLFMPARHVTIEGIGTLSFETAVTFSVGQETAYASPDTATLYPNEDITTEWVPTGASHYTEIDEGIASANDNDKLFTLDNTGTYIDKFGLTTQQSAIAECTQITVKVRAQNGSLSSYQYIDVRLLKADDSQIGSIWTINPVASSWTNYQNTWSSLSLSQSDINGLRVEVKKYSGSFGDIVEISALEVVITYVPSVAPPTLHDVPFDNEETPDTTPCFEFTAFDPDGTAGIVYQIEWDDDPNFGSPTTKTSDTDAGFENTVTPSDTSPFNEGEKIRFTIQAGDALSNSAADTAYYWRVSGKDDSGEGGSGVFGDWTTRKSLRVNTSLSLSQWVQTTDEQFDTGDLTNTQTSGSDSVQLEAAAPPVFAAATINTSPYGSSRSSATFSHTTPAGDNRLLLVIAGMSGTATVSSVTYGGNSLTFAKRQAYSISFAVEIWYLVNPPTGANNVVVTYSGSCSVDGIAALSYTGVNQSSPIGATAGNSAASGTNITVNITTTSANSLIVGGLANRDPDTFPHTPGTGTTRRYDFTSGTNGIGDYSYAGGDEPAVTTGSYTFNFTSSYSSYWAIAAVEVKTAVTDFESSGTITSPVIDNDWVGASWNQLSWTDDETDGDIIYQVLYYTTDWVLIPDGDLSGNSTGFDTSPVSLSGLNTTTYNEIKIKATFTKGTGTPYLQDWTVSWTSACSEDILNTPSNHDFGTVSENSTYETGLTKFTVTNNSGGAIDISIKGTDMTDTQGGTPWTLSDNCTPAPDTYGLKAGLDGGDYTIIVKKSSPFNLVEDLADGATQDWGLKLWTPTSYSDGYTKSGTVTLTATCT